MALNIPFTSIRLWPDPEPADMLPPELADDADYIEVGDVVEMVSRSGRAYYGTVIEINAARQRAFVEYLHPATCELWRVWREADEVSLVYKAGVIH